jgi:hypothetical protein
MERSLQESTVPTPQHLHLARAARLAASALVLAPALPAAAGVFEVLAPDTDWTLFHPTPRSELRPLAEQGGPATVDAGHAQIDVDVVDATVGGAAGEERLELLAFDARLGLTRRADLQLAFVPFRQADVVHQGGEVMSRGRGLGDTTVRLGLNLWGSDGGRSAAALVPFVRIPTATGGVGSGAFEGGLAVPLEVRLPGAVAALVRAQVEFADDHLGRRGVHPRMAVSAGLGRDVLGPVAVRAEWTTTAEAEGAPLTYTHAVDAQGRLAVGRDLQLRVGAAVGVLVDQPAIHPYVRVSYRR